MGYLRCHPPVHRHPVRGPGHLHHHPVICPFSLLCLVSALFFWSVVARFDSRAPSMGARFKKIKQSVVRKTGNGQKRKDGSIAVWVCACIPCCCCCCCCWLATWPGNS